MKAKADLVIVDIPLLYETGYESLIDQVAVRLSSGNRSSCSD